MLSSPTSTFDPEEFIDLDAALAEEELRSLGSIPEYNSRTNNFKLSFKSIDDQETERFRLSLITPLSKYSSVRSSTKSPADSCAESVALFKNLSTHENTDFASKDLKDFMPYDMDDLMSRSGSQAYTVRTPPLYRDSLTSTRTQRKSNLQQSDNRRWSSYEPQSSPKQRPVNTTSRRSSLLSTAIPERKKNIPPSEIPRRRTVLQEQEAVPRRRTLSNEREPIPRRRALSSNKDEPDSHYSSKHEPQLLQRRHTLHHEQEEVLRCRTLSNERELIQRRGALSGNKDEPDSHYNAKHEPQLLQRRHTLHHEQEAVPRRRTLSNERESIQRRRALSGNKDEPDSHYSTKQHEPQQYQRRHTLHHEQESVPRRRTLSHEQESVPRRRSLVHEQESIPRRRTLSNEQVELKQPQRHHYIINNDKQRLLPHRYAYQMSHQANEKAETISHGRQLTTGDRQYKQTEVRAAEPTRYTTRTEPKPSMMPVPVTRYRKHSNNAITHNSKYVRVPENSGLSSFNVAPTKDVRFAPSVRDEEVQVVPSRSSGGLSNSTESSSQSGDLYYDPPTPPSTNKGLSTASKRRSMPIIERIDEDDVTTSARKVLERVRQRRRERVSLLL